MSGEISKASHHMPTLCYFDFETRSGLKAPDLKKAGAYRYCWHADAIILAYALDDGPVQVVERCGAALAYADLPAELREHFEAGGVFTAWNASFDRQVWNLSLIDSPFMTPESLQDAMAAGLVSNLPESLDQASKALGGPGKHEQGARLIRRFSTAGAPPPDLDDPVDADDWQTFCAYAAQDVETLRRICKMIRPLPESEWEVFRSNERINDRGIAVDLDFVRQAVRLDAEDRIRTNARLAELTGNVITTINQHERLALFIYNRLPDTEAREIMQTRVRLADSEEEEEVEDAPIERGDISISRDIVVRLIDYLTRIESDDAVLLEILRLREFGGGAASKKYTTMLNQECNGRLHGQLKFNGAGQTGRFSGRGTQLQNMTRNVLGRDPGDDTGHWEAPTIDLITDGCSLDALAAHGAGEVPARKLALLVRPALIAPPRKTLLKADYASIEARTLPWLSKAKSAEAYLDSFRRFDAGLSPHDLYVVAASGMMRKAADDISKSERQRGKVATLALGYAGGKGALASMATNYGIYFTEEEAQEIVDQWRKANPWAPAFWGRHNREESYGLWGAAMRAYGEPMVPQKIGRVVFTYHPRYLGGTLLCRLPNGRLLTYPWCKWRLHYRRDKKTKEIIDERETLTFKRAHGFIALYGGRFAENITQAAAADLLREALVYLDRNYPQFPIVAHVHDEIVLEVFERDVEEASAALVEAMTYARPWTEGLPLAVDVTERFYYSAAKKEK